MKSQVLAVTALAITAISMPALAQNSQPNTAPSARSAPAQQQSAEGLWRASKLHGIDVYNQQNQKIGDIDDVLMDKDGKAKLAILGVGGFLGMGEHNVAVNFSELKFSDQAVKSSTSGSNADTNKSVRKNYPDHAVFNATKDQLKAMPQFRYGQ
jgi:sporulation protein YlmC with PRC-barrel domain